MKKYILIGLTCFMGMALGLSGCGKSPKQQLVVGLQSGYPPYEFIDEQGQLAGFDVELAHMLALSMNKPLIMKQLSFDALILALKSHKIDVILSGMSITKQRLNEIFMVPYNGEKLTYLQLIFWKEKKDSIDLLYGKTIAVQAGTFQEQILANYPEIKIKSLEDIQDLVMDIKYGKSQAALVDPSVGSYLKSLYEDIEIVDLPLLPHQSVLGEGIGINKDNPLLKDQIASLVQSYEKSGDLEKLRKKWFK